MIIIRIHVVIFNSSQPLNLTCYSPQPIEVFEANRNDSEDFFCIQYLFDVFLLSGGTSVVSREGTANTIFWTEATNTAASL